MLILTIRTDKPEAEIGLYKAKSQLAYHSWQAHRQLAETLHSEIKKLLESEQKNWQDIEGLVVFKGPGSFTGLRIGASVANALADTLELKIIATTGKNWREDGIKSLLVSKNDGQIVPEYGAEARTTTQKK